MKKTEYSVMVSGGVVSSATRKVYVAEDGKRYIRKDGKWQCIENTPCLNYLIKNGKMKGETK